MSDLRNRILCGDVRDRLAELPDESVHCVVTSPPYWGLRDYGVPGQLGLEPTPDEYVATMVEVFRDVRRVLRRDGTLWLNMGDCYASNRATGGGSPTGNIRGREPMPKMVPLGLKPKDLVGMPWRVALALQGDGWWLRSDIVWSKPSPMPESVRDRPTRAHEYVFLLARSRRYYYDADSIREPFSQATEKRLAQPTFWSQNGGPKDYGDESNRSARGALENLARRTPSGWNTRHDESDLKGRYPQRRDGDGNGVLDDMSAARKRDKQRGHHRRHDGFSDRWDAMSKDEQQAVGANARDVWTIPSQPFPGAHFATFPEELAARCIAAGTSARGCCPACGAPWMRMLKRMAVGDWSNNRPTSRTEPKGGAREYANWTAPQTIGWAPGCRCDAGEPVSTVVIDPFMGAGTTAVVALKMGRRYIGIELSPAYVEMAERRLRAEVPLLLEAGG